MANVFTGSNYDYKSSLQLQIEFSESNWASDGSSSTVTASYYFISVNNPSGYFSGDITSDYGTAQSVSVSLGSQSTTLNTNAFAIASSINGFGQKHYIGSLSQTVYRNANGDAVINASASCTLTWRSGYPSRSVSANYQCQDTKHTVYYNANGGTNAPSNQTKAYGCVLTLSTQVPTRDGYKFNGWATSSNGSVTYASGGQYGADSDITLYAVWELTDIGITVTGASIQIPYGFVDGYIYCDPSYYVTFSYSYSFTGTVSELKVTPYFVDNGAGHVANVNNNIVQTAENLYGNNGTFCVSIGTIGRSIINCGSESTVLIGAKFDYKIGSEENSQLCVVPCSLTNFKFINVSESSAFISRDGSTVTFKMEVDYPQSFGIITNKVYGAPKLSCNGTAMTISEVNSLSDKQIVTYTVSTPTSSPVNIQLDNAIALYGYDKPKNFVMNCPTSASNQIVVTNQSECKAFEFIESDEVQGLLRGGIVCAKEFIEGTEGSVLSESNFKFNTLNETEG